MSYRIAGIDVHKKMLAVVVSDVEVDGEYQFERIRYGSSPEHLRLLAEWLIAQQVEEVVMESTAQYWKPVWGALERYWKPICRERESGRPDVGNITPGASTIESRTTGTQERFPRCRTSGEAIGRKRTDSELCARYRTAAMAHGHTAEVPADTQPRAPAEPTGGLVGRVPH